MGLGIVRVTRKQANPNVGFKHQLLLLGKYGDMESASKEVKESNTDVMAEARILRERANALHEKLDTLEIDFVSSAKADATALKVLLTEIDEKLNVCFVSGDRVAITILKAGKQKAE